MNLSFFYDIDGARAFVQRVKNFNWFGLHGVLPDNTDVSDCEEDAYCKHNKRFIEYDSLLENSSDHFSTPNARQIFGEAWLTAAGLTKNIYPARGWDDTDLSFMDSLSDPIFECDTLTFANSELPTSSPWDSSWMATWDIAYALYYLFILSPTSASVALREHIAKRMAIWEAGYGVSYELDGILYAYKDKGVIIFQEDEEQERES